MANYRTVYETSISWQVKESQITRYCRDGRIEGAKKIKGNWMIPSDSLKPERGKKSVQNTTKKPLPVGVSSYKEASTHYYYVDKTMLIKDFLDERPKVSLFTRPHRFGKTLTMDMIRTFFEKTDEDTSIYFQDKSIWQQGSIYTNHQGRYPVIFLSFKDAKKDTWDQTLDHIIQLITSEYKRHSELKKSKKITNRDYYESVIHGTFKKEQFDISLRELTQMLHEHHGISPIVIIDEYDTPIEHGYTKGFYEHTIAFFCSLFSGAFKDNCHLSYGFLTGILSINKESIFSGLNNIRIYSILDKKYSQYFGFTSDEITQLASYYNAQDKINEICDWYDGYQFGDTEIFNPWSVINYFSYDCIPRPFWENTYSNSIIKEILEYASKDTIVQLNALMQGQDFITTIDTNVIYPEIKKNAYSIYSLLLVAGYLKAKIVHIAYSGDYICRVAIPNHEIAYVYKKEIISKLNHHISESVCISIQEALYLGDKDALAHHIQSFLFESVSNFDLVNENAYHMLNLGLCAMMSDQYYINSNREAGEGHFDIALMPKDNTLPVMLIEIKHTKEYSPAILDELAQKAFQQINEKQYDTEVKSHGIKSIIKYGVAFNGKYVKILKEEQVNKR